MDTNDVHAETKLIIINEVPSSSIRDGPWTSFTPLTASEEAAQAIGWGLAFSIPQVAKGAPFMSNNLWAPAIDLWMAALVFCPLMAPGRASALYANSVPAESQP